MKQLVQGLIRSLHVTLSTKPLPDRLGIYLHSLESEHWPAFSDVVGWFHDTGHSFCADACAYGLDISALTRETALLLGSH